MNTNDLERAAKAGQAAQAAVDAIIPPGMTIQLTPSIWAMVTAKFPWAREEPEEAVVFLLGVAIGVWIERDKEELE